MRFERNGVEWNALSLPGRHVYVCIVGSYYLPRSVIMSSVPSIVYTNKYPPTYIHTSNPLSTPPHPTLTTKLRTKTR